MSLYLGAEVGGQALVGVFLAEPSAVGGGWANQVAIFPPRHRQAPDVVVIRRRGVGDGAHTSRGRSPVLGVERSCRDWAKRHRPSS